MVTRSTVDRIADDLGELIESRDAGGGDGYDAWADDPVGFVRDVLGGDPWAAQVRIADAVRDRSRVTVRSCHAAGKDWIAARLALWWVYARGGLVVLTGPTRAQVEEILMRGEVRDAFVRGGLPGDLHVSALRPAGEGRAGILAKTATGVSALTGFHDARVLFVVTEAQDPEIEHAWDAAFAVATGAEDRIVTLGNPTSKDGRFWRAHRSGSDWRALKIAASDVPNVREGETVVPGLLTREGVDRFASEYGEDSGFYASRVLAEFPDEAEDALIRRSWLEDAADRWARSQRDDGDGDDEPLVAALDPARHGPDASVLAIRRGDVVSEIVAWEGRVDTMELARDVAAALRGRGFRERRVGVPDRDRFGRRVRRGAQRAEGRVVVDEVGVGGGVADRLDEAGFRVEGFNAGRRAVESERYHDRRAEAYWRLRELLERGELAVVWDDETIRQLTAVRWRATPSGKVQLESKRDAASRLGGSPDRADAIAMLVAPERTDDRPTTRVGSVGSGSG